jgi:lysophospholipase L1-like esterase
MNTNPQAVKILCYGDSNTWGYVPISETRFPVDVRWTGLLQSALGDGYWIIEEGFNGRTTTIEDPDSPGKNGLQYLYPCLRTHNPIDLIILMLGTNDTKCKLNRSAGDIASGINQLLNEIRQTAWNNKGEAPVVLLLSPPMVDESVERARDEFAGAAEKTAQLPALYQSLAEQHAVFFRDVSQWVSPSPRDGIHLEPVDHRIVAENLFNEILSLNIK